MELRKFSEKISKISEKNYHHRSKRNLLFKKNLKSQIEYITI